MTAEFAAMAHPAALPTGAAARPRVSAESFRNLAARLKKADTSIPSVAPVISPVVPDINVAPALPLAPVQAFEPAPVPAPARSVTPVPAEIVVSPAPVAASVAEAVMQLDPVVEPKPVMPLGVQVFNVESKAPAPVAVEEQATLNVLSVEVLPLEPVLAEPLAPPAPVAEIATIEPIWQPDIAPVAMVHVEAAAEQQFEQPVDLPHALPIDQPSELPVELQPELAVVQSVALPIETPAEHVAAVAETASAPELQGSFAENFTYVPEGGKAEPPPPVITAENAAEDPAVAERAVQLELENIWRMLLAKPTAEDRAQYLREAALHHATDEEWNKPAPEHDLSLIEPSADAALEEPGIEALASTEIRSLQDTLPVAEGQDLAELSRSLLDMMAQGASSGLPHERALAADTLLRLVPRLELKPLVVLAQRLAMMDNPPNLLVSRLIRDTRVEVAGPLLEDCPHISDKDLELVVTEAEPARLRMIARRRHLTRAISDALIRSGEPSVVLTLVRNMEAEISHDGFLSLLVLCENNEELMAPLATRQDLGAPFAFELFWVAPPQLRRFILSRFLTDSETLTKILKITMATKNDDEAEAEPLSQHALLEALERAARGHLEVAVNELAQIMQLSPATITRILGDLQGDAIVVMLKAAAYPRSAVTGLLKRMQGADLPLVTRDRDVSELQTMFETLSFNKARILLTYWDWAQAKTGPYAPVQ